LQHDVIPLGLGGDHTVTLPILRAIAAKHGPVGLIHVDAHADINDEMFGEKIAHGTTFRRAQEEGLLAGAWCRSACAAAAMPPRISTGRAVRAFAWSGGRVLEPLAAAADAGSAPAAGRRAGLPEF
jgi:guanidinobutyrase